MSKHAQNMSSAKVSVAVVKYGCVSITNRMRINPRLSQCDVGFAPIFYICEYFIKP